MVDLNSLFSRSVNKHQANMQRVNILAQNEARKVLSVMPDMTFNQQASHVRNTIPTVISKYGAVAALVGATHYNEMRSLQPVSFELEPYTATVPTTFNFDDTIYNMMGYAIAKNSNEGLSAMTAFLVDELTLHVSNYDRKTIQYNASNEPKYVKIQRVAEARACAFCRTLAAAGVVYEGIVWDEDVVQYADDWHSNCHCSTETIYSNADGKFEPIEPSYYPAMKDEYQKAYDNQSAYRQSIIDEHLTEFDGSYRQLFKAYPDAAINTKNVVAQMRQVSGAK